MNGWKLYTSVACFLGAIFIGAQAVALFTFDSSSKLDNIKLFLFIFLLAIGFLLYRDFDKDLVKNTDNKQFEVPK